MATITGIVAEKSTTTYVWDTDSETYILSGARTFVGPNDPSSEGFTLVDGDEWVNPDV